MGGGHGGLEKNSRASAKFSNEGGQDGNRREQTPRNRNPGGCKWGKAGKFLKRPGTGHWVSRGEHAGSRVLVNWNRIRIGALSNGTVNVIHPEEVAQGGEKKGGQFDSAGVV